MTTREQHTFCRICEPMCGLVATVEDGRLVTVRPDHDHVHSQGFCCTKAQGDGRGHLRRRPARHAAAPGRRARRVRARVVGRGAGRHRHAPRRPSGASTGREALATFFGNPPAFIVLGACSPSRRVPGGARRASWRYGVNAEDGASRTASPATCSTARPSSLRCPTCGAPTSPLMHRRQPLRLARLAGQRTAVPRRAGQHRRAGRPGRGDRPPPDRDGPPLRARRDPGRHRRLAAARPDPACSSRGLVDHAFLAEHTPGSTRCAELVRPFTPERCAAECGVAADDDPRARPRPSRARPSALRLRPHRHLHAALRHAQQRPPGHALRRHRQPRPSRAALVSAWALDRLRPLRRAGAGWAPTARCAPHRRPARTWSACCPSTSLVTDITTPGPGTDPGARDASACNPVHHERRRRAAARSGARELDLHVVARPVRERDEQARRLRAAGARHVTSGTTSRCSASASCSAPRSWPPTP